MTPNKRDWLGMAERVASALELAGILLLGALLLLLCGGLQGCTPPATEVDLTFYRADGVCSGSPIQFYPLPTFDPLLVSVVVADDVTGLQAPPDFVYLDEVTLGARVNFSPCPSTYTIVWGVDGA